MSWHFSQALEEVFSGRSCSDGEPCAQWRSMPSAQDDSSSDRMKGTCHRSPFGTMFVPLTDARGAALLTWYREDFLARTFRSPAQERESMANGAESGERCTESSVRYDLDSSCWKTHRCLFEEVLPESSVSLPSWGMMRDGVVWERSMPELPTAENGFSLWVTPIKRDHKDSPGMARVAADGRKRLDTLPRQVFAFWPAPTVSGNTNRPKPGTKRGYGLRSAILDFGMEESPYAAATENTGSLNPDFMEWLMGWPTGWSAQRPLETDKFREWWSWPGICWDRKERG